jgi:hypothetical protein
VPGARRDEAINVLPTGPLTANSGDFRMVEGEVNPMSSTLRATAIEVTATYQHHLGEEPRLFYMYFWANGDPASLARGLRAALDQTASGPPQASLAR